MQDSYVVYALSALAPACAANIHSVGVVVEQAIRTVHVFLQVSRELVTLFIDHELDVNYEVSQDASEHTLERSTVFSDYGQCLNCVLCFGKLRIAFTPAFTSLTSTARVFRPSRVRTFALPDKLINTADQLFSVCLLANLSAILDLI